MKKFICCLCIMVFIGLNIDIVKASVPLNVIFQSSVYGNKLDGKTTYYGKLGIIYIDGKVGYCLDPYKLIGQNYSSDNSYLNNYSTSDLKYFELVSYFGFNHTNHYNAFYYMAAQELIWERITKQDVYWTSGEAVIGSIINIDKYKNIIETLVNDLYVKPSFDGASLEGNFYDVIKLDDSNQVLSNYQVLNNSQNQVWIEGNSLYVKLLSSDISSIKLVRKVDTDNYSNTYIDNSSNQILGSFGLHEEITSSISARATNEYSSKVSLNVIDSRTNMDIESVIRFKIKDLNSNSFVSINGVEEMSTNQYGDFNSDFYLKSGSYQIVNTDIPKGYIINNPIFEIKEDNYLSDQSFVILDKLDSQMGIISINRSSEIIKKGEGELAFEDALVEGSKYEIYVREDIIYNNNLLFKKDQLIDTVFTNTSGIATSIELPLGKYYIKEAYISNEFLPINNYIDVEFNFLDFKTPLIYNNLDLYTKYDNLNLSIKTTLKDDSLVNGNTYGLYAGEDIVYNNACLFGKDELIKDYDNSSGLLNSELKIPYGSYYIKELTNNDKYYKDNNKYDFSFASDSEAVTLNIIKEEVINKFIEESVFNSNILSLENTIDRKDSYLNIVDEFVYPNTTNYLKKYDYFILLLVGIGIGVIKYKKKNL